MIFRSLSIDSPKWISLPLFRVEDHASTVADHAIFTGHNIKWDQVLANGEGLNMG